jgi:hypothetical protein
MSSMKEPYFFATDFQSQRYISDERHYRRLFARSIDGKLCGESSASYLGSKTAVSAMLAANPAVKVIALVRNPLDLFVSYHNENFRMRREDICDVEEAWQLQEARSHGEAIPPGCPDTAMLQYREILKLGKQIKALFEVVPADQRLVLLFDDLKSDSAGTMKRILRFLQVDENVALRVPTANIYSLPRSLVVADLIRYLDASPAISRFRVRFRPSLERFGMWQFQRLFELNLRTASKPVLRPEFRGMLVDEFRSDVILLNRLLGRDLSHWKEFSEPIPAFAPAGSH